ncbi:MAG: hydantoinase B/oxoprolinase family protein [Candidatus Lustribacter sp.]|jgi:N-methylhydantoinase B
MDPITLELINASLLAYADEMSNNFWRTSYSYMNYEVRDYAVGFIDPDGRIMTQSRFTHPAFTADLGFTVKAAIDTIGDEGILAGDIVATNDPDSQGQHLNNVTVFSPLVIDGETIGYACIRAHWQDVGGATVGSSPNSTDIFQEGIQYDAVKVYRAGRPNPDVLRIIAKNTRFPELVLGDLNAQIAVAKLGLRRLQSLVDKYGIADVREAVRTFWDLSETAARKMVRSIPDGEYHAESFLDNDGVEFDKPVPIRVRVVVRGDDMTIDFSEIADQVKGSLNSGYYGGAMNVARIAFKCLTTPHLVSNEGCFRPLDVVCPEGKILNARPGAALYNWAIPFPTIIDTIFKALSDAIPERITAATRGDARGVGVTGFDERKRKYFTIALPHIGGHGARPFRDGPAPRCAIQQGDEHSMPVEVNEIKFPILFEKYALREDSAGAGKFRGGMGIEIRAAASIDGRMRNPMIRSKCLPWGIAGGGPGAPNVAYAVKPDGTEEPVGRTIGYPLPLGWQVHLMTGGGGGYGDPLERPASTVRDDVVAGYVSAASAERDYGVVLQGPDFELDVAATERLRSERAARAAR